MKMRHAVATVVMLVGSSALGGVDGGNPKRTPFFNMTLGYRLTPPSGMEASPTGTAQAVRVEGPLTYRDLGHFVIAREAPELRQGEAICDKYEVARSKAILFWVGRDCAHPYFSLRFKELKDGVLALVFPN